MIIKTERDWNLKVTQRGKTGCVDIIELHRPDTNTVVFEPINNVAIPLEALDEVIEFLQKVKLKVEG